MGTQFTSRLKASDRKRIYNGIVDSLFDQIPTAPKPAKGAKPKAAPAKRPKKAAAVAETVKSLSSTQRRRFGEAAVANVLNVAAGHGFFEDFEESHVFVDVLELLLRWRSDAEFNGFEGIIKEYGMEKSANASGDLARKLEAVANNNWTDPFRVASTFAAKAILVETSLLTVPPITDEAPARTFGRKLATLRVRDLVTTYIQRFVYEVLSKPLSMSDRSGGTVVVRTAMNEVQKTTERIARKAVDEIVKEGALHNSKRIHQIVIAALMEYIELPKAS
jgi:hypothetical protein